MRLRSVRTQAKVDLAYSGGRNDKVSAETLRRASQAQDSRLYMHVSAVVAAQAPEVCTEDEQES